MMMRYENTLLNDEETPDPDGCLTACFTGESSKSEALKSNKLGFIVTARLLMKAPGLDWPCNEVFAKVFDVDV